MCAWETFNIPLKQQSNSCIQIRKFYSQIVEKFFFFLFSSIVISLLKTDRLREYATCGWWSLCGYQRTTRVGGGWGCGWMLGGPATVTRPTQDVLPTRAALCGGWFGFVHRLATLYILQHVGVFVNKPQCRYTSSIRHIYERINYSPANVVCSQTKRLNKY